MKSLCISYNYFSALRTWVHAPPHTVSTHCHGAHWGEEITLPKNGWEIHLGIKALLSTQPMRWCSMHWSGLIFFSLEKWGRFGFWGFGVLIIWISFISYWNPNIWLIQQVYPFSVPKVLLHMLFFLSQSSINCILVYFPRDIGQSQTELSYFCMHIGMYCLGKEQLIYPQFLEPRLVTTWL
jgi:hypothetical protein